MNTDLSNIRENNNENSNRENRKQQKILREVVKLFGSKSKLNISVDETKKLYSRLA
jgi:hypothetical protein